MLWIVGVLIYGMIHDCMKLMF